MNNTLNNNKLYKKNNIIVQCLLFYTLLISITITFLQSVNFLIINFSYLTQIFGRIFILLNFIQTFIELIWHVVWKIV